MITLKNILILFLMLILISSSFAEDLKFARIFNDNCLLQRDMNTAVWGWADPQESVSVSFAGQKVSVTADDKGKWLVRLNKMSASAEGKDLIATTNDETVKVTNVIVGDVWFANGQSNMAGGILERYFNQYERGRETLANFELPAIRYCTIGISGSGIPQEDINPNLFTVKGKKLEQDSINWRVCRQNKRYLISAIALFFAQKIHLETGVPIGIISVPKGGSMIELHMPLEAYSKTSSYKESHIEKIKGKEDAGFVPTSIYNSRIHPFLNYAIKGMIWYQGESNTTRDQENYGDKLVLFIEAMRKLKTQGDFPFYYVQLDCHGKEITYPNRGWAIVQDQMRLVLDRLPNVGMCVTNDIYGHHPNNKLDGAQRLADWALAKDYGKDIVYSGPLYKEHSVEGNKLKVTFNHLGSGFIVAEKDELNPLVPIPNGVCNLFEVAGKDGEWFKAKATIEGKTLTVQSSKVAEPAHVRYAFQETYSGPRVYNKEGFPMSPFTSTLLESDLTKLRTFEKEYPMTVRKKARDEIRARNTKTTDKKKQLKNNSQSSHRKE